MFCSILLLSSIQVEFCGVVETSSQIAFFQLGILIQFQQKSCVKHHQRIRFINFPSDTSLGS